MESRIEKSRRKATLAMSWSFGTLHEAVLRGVLALELPRCRGKSRTHGERVFAVNSTGLRKRARVQPAWDLWGGHGGHHAPPRPRRPPSSAAFSPKPSHPAAAPE